MDDFVGRENAVQSLKSLLTKRPSRRLVVASISGPGGVGKSFLLEHVLAGVDLEGEKYLKLSSHGRDAPVAGLIDLITRRLLQSCKQVDAENLYMRRTRECRKALDAIDKAFAVRVARAAKKEPLLGGVDVVRVLAHAGVSLADVLAHTKIPEVKATAMIAKGILRHVEKNPAIAEKTAQLIHAAATDPSGARFAGALTKRLLRDATGAVCDAFVADLTDMLVGWEKRKIENLLKLLPPKASSVDRLLLVLDDYESLTEPTRAAFIHELLPKLAAAGFDSSVIVIGRDALTDAHLEWSDKIEKYLGADIRLSELSVDDASRYVRERGITDETTVKRIVDDTRGFPFLLATEVEAENSGGRSALTIEKFIARTTRWMTNEQRDWLVHLSFLDAVNEDSIAVMLPGEDAKGVLDWFKREPSIRSPSGVAGWQVLPIVRSRVLAHVKLDSPRRYEELAQRAGATAA